MRPTAEGDWVNTCPECGTVVRADVHWCVLCYHDLRQVPESAEVAASSVGASSAGQTAAAAAASAGPSTGGSTDPAGTDSELAEDADAEPAEAADAEPRWPCSRCEAQNDYSDATCAICGAPFLAGAGESSGVHLPVVGDVTQMSTLSRYLLALGVALAVIVVVAAVGLLI